MRVLQPGDGLPVMPLRCIKPFTLTGPPDAVQTDTYWRCPMRLGALALVLFVLCLSVVPAHADTVYTYTGDYFGTFVYNGQPRVAGVYTTADRITGSFTVADGFVPGFTSGGATFTGFGVLPTANGDYSPSTFMDGVLSYSFSDGHQTLTKANSTAAFYLEVPDHYDLSAWGAGFRPGLWSIGITASTRGIASYL